MFLTYVILRSLPYATSLGDVGCRTLCPELTVGDRDFVSLEREQKWWCLWDASIKNSKIQTLQQGSGLGREGWVSSVPSLLRWDPDLVFLCCGKLMWLCATFWIPFSPGLLRRSGGKKTKLQSVQLSIWPPTQAPTCILSVTIYDPSQSELSNSDLVVQKTTWRAENLSQEIFAGCIETNYFLIKQRC